VSEEVDEHDGRHDALVRLLDELREVELREDRRGALELMLAAISRYAGWPLAHAYRFDREAGLLRPVSVWHELELGRYAALRRAAAGTTLGPDEDLPGRAFRNRRLEWTVDISEQTRFANSDLGRFPELDAAIAVPVLVAGNVDTVLELFGSETQVLDERVRSVLEHVATAWGRSMELSRRPHLLALPDTGDRRATAERRAAAEEFRLHGAAAAHVRDAIVVSTAGSGRGPTILYVNAAFTRMTGYTEAEVLGRSFSVLAGAKTSRAALETIHRRFQRGAGVSAELIAYRKDGHEFLLEWHASPIVESDGTVEHFASIQRDITEERSVQQALRRADRDALTGLPTREVLEKRIRLSIMRAQERSDYRFALLFLDMDGFKTVNDEHGHMVGDQLLASAARRLEGAIRPGDALARFGGDEFVILLHSVTDIRDVTMVADRVQERMAAPFEIQGNQLNVAASIGITLGHAGYDHPEEVIRDADTAMYEAKRKGTGGVEFFSGGGEGAIGPRLRPL